MARNWIKDQAKPSFKGVPFDVSTDSIISGRRVAVHEYPGSESWDLEDLGRQVFQLEVEGFVDGDTADQRSQDLQAACTSPGSGTLVLPQRPQQEAYCRGIKSDWQADALGRINVRMQFIAVSRIAGGIVPSTQTASQVANQANKSSDAIQGDFSQNFNSASGFFPNETSVPASARIAAGETISLVADALLVAVTAVRISDPKIAAQVRFGARQIRERARAYAEQGESPYRIDGGVFVDNQEDTASAFGRVFADTLKLMTQNADDPSALIAALKPLTVFEAQALANTDLAALSVRAESTLTASVAGFVRRLALIRWAQAMTKVQYVSRSDATTAKGFLAPAFSAEIAAAQTPPIAGALLAVQGEVAGFLVRNGAQLPKTVTIAGAGGVPAAVMAAMLYDDASRDQELYLRNGIENHPLNLPDVIEALAPDGL